MDARAKVVVVNGEALLETLHGLFEVFQLLVAHAEVVERVGFGWNLALSLILVICVQLDCSLQRRN